MGRPPSTAWIAALVLCACACRGPARERIVVAAVRQPATSLFFVAQGAGCFDAERLDVEERTFELGRDAIALLREGGADAAVVYEAPLLRNAFADPRLRVLTALHSATRNTRLVARRDRGVLSFADLRGRRIGAAQGTNADFFVGLILRYGGVPRAETEIVNVSPAGAVEALSAGTLDAAVLSDPPASSAEHALGDRAAVVQTELYAEFSLLVTREDVIRARRPAMLALLRGLACAERAVRERPEESFRHVRNRFPELEEGELRTQLARVTRGLGLENVLMDVLRREAQWMRESAVVEDRPLDLERLVEPALLEEVEPEAVMLLRRGS